MPIIHENILKVLDIHYGQFTREFIGFMAKQQPIYKDRVLEEDLFSPDEIRADNTDIPVFYSAELTEVEDLMKRWDCSYFRIIYT